MLEADQLKDQPPSYPTSAKKRHDWDSLAKQVEVESKAEQKTLGGEEATSKLFQDVFGQGDDDVKKAMMKSFVSAEC